MRSPALGQYVIISLNLAYLEDYDTLCNVVYLNTILLNRIINQNQNLISNNTINFSNKVSIDFKVVENLQERVSKKSEYDVTVLKMYKLYMYMLFSTYLVQYNMPETLVYTFIEAAESIDYLAYSKLSTRFLDVLGFYTIELQLTQNYHEEIKIAYKTVMNKYYELLDEGFKPNEETKQAFDTIEMISNELDDNRFDPDNYQYVFPNGITYEDVDSNEILKLWDQSIREKYVIN